MERIAEFWNWNLDNIVTPVDVDVLEELLVRVEYDSVETQFVINGFRFGFSLGYQGNMQRTTTSHNLKLTCGSKTQPWNKVMKEVQLCRFVDLLSKFPSTITSSHQLVWYPKAVQMIQGLFFICFIPGGTL